MKTPTSPSSNGKPQLPVVGTRRYCNGSSSLLVQRYIVSALKTTIITYEELAWFGRLRKIDRCVPYWMYRKLSHMRSHLAPTTVAEKVKAFFFHYAVNRHKMTTLTPSYHAENYSPDDNRFDLRPFLYNALWTRQFRAIDMLATKLEERKNQ